MARDIPKGLKNEEIPIGAPFFPLSIAGRRLAIGSIGAPFPWIRPCSCGGESGKAYDPVVVEVLGRRYVELEEMAARPEGGVKLSTDIKVERGAAPRRFFLRNSEASSGRRPLDFLSRSGLREMRRRCV